MRLDHRRRRNRPCLNHWERLLLNGFRMPLQETVVELAVALRGSFETKQGHLGLIGFLGLRYEPGEPALELSLPLFGNFVFALCCFLDSFQFIENGIPRVLYLPAD